MLFYKVERWFKEAVQLHPTASSDLKQTLLRGHPGLDAFLRRITREIEKADLHLRRQGKIVKQKTMQDLVYDMTNYFIIGMEGEANRRRESDLARIAREAEQNKIQEFESVLAGNAVGEFAEAGVVNDEKLEKQREAHLEKRDQEIKAQKAREQKSN